eukprot:Gb_17428 [translate_table: standard]
MQQAGIQPDRFTFPFILKACAALSALQQGMEIHDQIIRSGIESNVYVGNALIDMYAKCKRIDIARHVFDKMFKRDVVSWTAMMVGFCQNGHPNESLTLFRQMQLTGIKPNQVTNLSVLTACAGLTALQLGKQIHNYIIKVGFESDDSVVTTLIAMYAKCGSIEVAHQLFDKIPKKDVVSWSEMIAGYAQNGHADEALALFRQMQLAGVKPNQVTIVSVLPACAEITNLQQGKDIHDYIIKTGFQSDASVGTALVAMYAKCGSMELALQVFNMMVKIDVVAWNAIIAGFAQNGYAIEALAVFCEMQLADVKPNSVTMVSVLPACAHLAAQQKGSWIHAYVIKSGFESDASVGNAVIDMYAKCGSIDVACQLFDKMPKTDVVTWSAMIAGYAQNGHANEALTLFHEMQLADVKPNGVTIVSVLSACADLGSLQQGKNIHDSIIKNGIELDVSLETALVAMYAKCGSVEIACQLFDNMYKRDVVSWNTMIAGYGMHGHAKDALELFLQMQEIGMKLDSYQSKITVSI